MFTSGGGGAGMHFKPRRDKEGYTYPDNLKIKGKKKLERAARESVLITVRLVQYSAKMGRLGPLSAGSSSRNLVSTF